MAMIFGTIITATLESVLDEPPRAGTDRLIGLMCFTRLEKNYNNLTGRYMKIDSIIEALETRSSAKRIGFKLFTFYPKYLQCYSYSGNKSINKIDVY